MTISLYNTASRRKEDLFPIDPPEIKMYVCGITPYDESHLGHARAYITFDVIKRYLVHAGYKVRHVQNITDIDDKIIAKAMQETGERTDLKQKCREIAEKYSASFFDAMDKLNVLRADVYPKATDHIPEMIDWIKGLEAKGIAYELPDGIYFSVGSFSDYGKLSGRRLDEQEEGGRVKEHKGKKNPFDFVLWKKAKEGEPSWPSPWGEGRPGWHIECSVMSTKYLGQQFDIHGGGLDLEFPHHENEIAQTESLTGKRPWVKYWLHNGFVTVNKEKMSKSLGNFFTLKDIFEKFDPMVIRFYILSTHYRSPINYSDAEMRGGAEAYDRVKQFLADLDFMLEKSPGSAPMVELNDIIEELQPYLLKFEAAMSDDFNSAGAIAALFEMIKYCRKTLDEGEDEKECLQYMRDTVATYFGHLGITFASAGEELDSALAALISERETARANKDFKRSDEIRDQLKGKGIILEDTPYGTKWSRS
ncbi:cysteine--tRNA ligase [candidate division WOR-1 bacterium RIFOXYA12_FULL_52_29]|uniref:Cysteine--tRNA ligase n=1 Tax=candidate division WOR-1 bacterium RIFOXYC12_FULL_54_18 TaxID=1802584 RepID=A0A1F4T567_UNCSA|nr:MAG: cysteine--tRNA ligase [candidate division WOR-1 bacterium RIFOXYA2_FULL_51_19]OGC17528.1 MAG: cysteine--tRNA ligase [candidate division WOR-1 bacterium RIFOXYA12_FULL_52_29]OGC26385.1 MAG: cysteine--tRNA ligase [candidate division WOR-1 bacterium RIFOXYB2_FULL_45_9]OGC27945.1 MAG: cysteine--tRNA ligase [candidate division WOR-1 bacterium RIFOXYC12_FULL_54_18]OGC29768.1 MAG: cysteine--tRNA ligase [candidate division WOR-1 bacterium RIFOXYB12_FULL_52_16]